MSLVAYYPLNGNLKDIIHRNDFNINYLYGDVDGNNIIENADATLVQQAAAHNITLTSEQQVRGDVNEDEKTDALDAALILRKASGSIDTFSAGTYVPNQPRFTPVWEDGKTASKSFKISTSGHYGDAFIEKLKRLSFNNGFSVSFWIKMNSRTAKFGKILSFYTYKSTDDSTKMLRIENNYSSGEFYHWFNNDHLTNDGGTVVSDWIELGKWYHITTVFGKTKCSLYMNGSLYRTNNYTYSSDDISLTGKVKIGPWEGTPNLDINISDIKIYDHQLSKEEVYQDYLSPMLHYTFEQPYAEETENISHSFTKQSFLCVSYGSDINGDYFIKTPHSSVTNGWMAGLELGNNTVFGGNYYTWSVEVNPSIDLKISENAHAYIIDKNGNRQYIWFDRNISPDINWSGNDQGCDIIDTYLGNIPKNTWTRIWITVYINQSIGKARLWHSFCPICTSSQSEIKCYYRNSMLEKKDHMSPYTRVRRTQGLIRDNSGHGNDGIIKYKREEIPILTDKHVTASKGSMSYNSTNKTYTITNFTAVSNSYDNETFYFGYINRNPSYHYLNSILSYEFDIKLENIVIESGKTFGCNFQGPDIKTDGTLLWDSGSPIHTLGLTGRLKNGANGTYHITIEKEITSSDSIATDISKYQIGIRTNYITSGTITVSNLHAYYRNLDTSTLGLSTNDHGIGVHSIKFKNGKERLEIPRFCPDEMEEFTYSVWLYRDEDNIGDYYRNLFTSHSNKGTGSPIWISYDTESSGLWAYIYGNDDKFHYFRAGSPGLVKVNEWNHIVYTFKNGISSFYLNGELIKTSDDSSTYTKLKYINNSDTQPYYIGERLTVGSSGWRDGLFAQISDLKLYPIALTEDEVKALYRTKAKIDKDSNMYTNQLVETKQENIFKLSINATTNQFGGGSYTKTFKDGIYTFKVTNPSYTNNSCGPYFSGTNFNAIPNKHYRYSLWVKFPRKGSWTASHERIRSTNYWFELKEANKWIHIEYNGICSSSQYQAFVFYHANSMSDPLQTGDEIQIRDFEFYRIDDDLLPIERDTDPKITKKVQVKGFELNEIDYDRLTKRQNVIEKDGAKWVEVFYHNTNNNTVWFTDEAEALHCTSQYKYSRLDCLEQYRQADGRFEFLLEYPVEHPGEFNRWKQTDNPAKVEEVPSSSAVTSAKGYEVIHIDWTTGFGGLLKHANNSVGRSITFIDGKTNHENWFFAIGCYHNSAVGSWPAERMPGPELGTNNSFVTEVRLYTRISDEQINLGPTIINKYGAQWLEVFYHQATDANGNKVWFTNKEEAMHTISKYKYSILDCLEQYRGRDNKFEFLLEYPNDLPNLYCRWKQEDNPVEIKEDTSSSIKETKGFEIIHSDSDRSDFGGLLRSSTSSCFIDGSTNVGQWFFAIGCYQAWNISSGLTGIPGFMSSHGSYINNTGVVNDTHLYVRIDNIDNKQQIAKLLKTGVIKTKEIKEV